MCSSVSSERHHLLTCCLTEHCSLFLNFSPTAVNVEFTVLPPISWSSPPTLHSLPSSPHSRDGSSHTEQFPISFVHAGSSKP